MTGTPGLLERCESCVRDELHAQDCVVVPLVRGQGLGCVVRFDLPGIPDEDRPVTLHARLNRALALRGLPPVRATYVAEPGELPRARTGTERRRAVRRHLGAAPGSGFAAGFSDLR